MSNQEKDPELENLDLPEDEENIENIEEEGETDDITDIVELVESDPESEETSEKNQPESKHKIKGKHSLGYDSIFKGKKKTEEVDDDEFSQDLLIPKQENFDFDVSSGYHEETKDPEEYIRHKELKEEIYKIIISKTDINIKNSRRKPGRIDFNKYYQTLVENLDTSKYSYAEIFVDLSYYFSDNIFNMFKLLDKKWGGKIIKELAKKRNIKIGKIDFL